LDEEDLGIEYEQDEDQIPIRAGSPKTRPFRKFKNHVAGVNCHDALTLLEGAVITNNNSVDLPDGFLRRHILDLVISMS